MYRTVMKTVGDKEGLSCPERFKKWNINADLGVHIEAIKLNSVLRTAEVKSRRNVSGCSSNDSLLSVWKL